MKKINFSEEEKEKICKLFENGVILREIAQIFRYSGGPIGKLLIENLGLEQYKELAKEHKNGNGRKVSFSHSKKEKICELFENGAFLSKITEIFGSSRSTIRGILIEILGLEKYKTIAKDHLKENNQKNAIKMNNHPKMFAIRQKNGQKYGGKNLKNAWKDPTELMIISCQKNGRKAGKLPKTESQLKASRENGNTLVEWNTKNPTWISRPEALFYLTILSKNFWLKDIVPQYYIKEINHRADFAVPSQKLLFEVDGDYYHGHSGNKEMDTERLKRDAEIDKWAKDNSWTIFRYNDAAMKKFGII